MNSDDFGDSYFAARVATDAARMRMHELDRLWILRHINFIAPTSGKSHRTYLDIGCADGRFLKGFNFSEGTWGIEPNARQQDLARSNGLQIANSISDVPNLDSVIMRGVLHHLPDYKETIGQIIESFKHSDSPNKKFLFLLANPNAHSFFYRKFGRLPALEFGKDFDSIHKVHAAKDIMNELKSFGFIGRIQYPYLHTPYSSPIRDFSFFSEKCR